MGENEQGGMLRSVVVIGLVAIIAMVVIFGVVAMKGRLRTNTLMGATMGQNVLQTNQRGSDTHYKFNPLDGNTQLSWDDKTNVYTLTLPSNVGAQGMYYGGGGGDASKSYSAFLPGDKYKITAEMRTDDVSLFDKVDYSIYFEGSNNGDGLYVHPKMSNEWQYFETNGVRLQTWGAPFIYFKNDSGSPVTVQVRNVQVIRKA